MKQLEGSDERNLRDKPKCWDFFVSGELVLFYMIHDVFCLLFLLVCFSFLGGVLKGYIAQKIFYIS